MKMVRYRCCFRLWRNDLSVQLRSTRSVLERALARLRCRWGCRLSRSCSGSLLASSTALALRSKYQFLRGAALSYIEVVRNTPFLLQVFFIFFGLPLLGLSFSPWSAAILANAQTVESIKKGGVLKVGAQVAQVP